MRKQNTLQRLRFLVRMIVICHSIYYFYFFFLLFCQLFFWYLLYYCDSEHDLIDISNKLNIELIEVINTLDKLIEKDLVKIK